MDAGRVKETVKQRAIQKKIKTLCPEVVEGVKRKNHAVQFRLEEQDAVSLFSDTILVPVRLLEEEKGDYIKVQVNDILNHLWAECLLPFAMTVNLLFPLDTKETCLRFVMDCLEETAQRERFEIANVNAECSPYVTGTLIDITVMGKAGENAWEGVRAFLPQREIVMAGITAAEGTVLLENAGQKLLSERFSKQFLERLEEYPNRTRILEPLQLMAKRQEKNIGVFCVGRSGIFGALWEISHAAGKGFCVDLQNIPISQETIEICEFFDVNPYMLRSGGCVLLAAENGRQIVDDFLTNNIPAAVIGRMEHHADKLVVNGDEHRYLDMPSAVKIGQNVPEGLEWVY